MELSELQNIINKSWQENIKTPTILKPRRLKNRITGVEGIFIKEFRNYYGEAIMVITDNQSTNG